MTSASLRTSLLACTPPTPYTVCCENYASLVTKINRCCRHRLSCPVDGSAPGNLSRGMACLRQMERYKPSRADLTEAIELVATLKKFKKAAKDRRIQYCCNRIYKYWRALAAGKDAKLPPLPAALIKPVACMPGCKARSAGPLPLAFASAEAAARLRSMQDCGKLPSREVHRHEMLHYLCRQLCRHCVCDKPKSVPYCKFQVVCS